MALIFPIPRADARGRRLQSTLLALFLLLTGLMTPHDASGQSAAPAAPVAASPTGRTPRLLWTPQRQAVWNQMVATNHPWWQKLRAWADGTKAQWGDIGDYSTIAYQMTGDPKYAQRAWSIIQPWASSMTLPVMNLNQTREDFISYGWMYDWLYPALTPAQRMTYINWLNWQGDIVLGRVPWGGTRLNDNDCTIGHYFGLAFVDLATSPENPRAGTFLNSTWMEGSTSKSLNVGGLTSTGINRMTMRNAISDYVNKAMGGVNVESSDYNLGTMKLLLIGAEGVKTATGKDYFPEITAFVPQLALAHLYQHSPDGIDSYQWGDTQHNRGLWIQTRVTLTGMLAGLTQGNPAVGPYLQKLTQEQTTSPVEWNGGASPYARFFLFFNPYAPAADWRTDLPKSYIASGRGLLYHHDGWQNGSSFFGGHMDPLSWEDHEIGYFGNFQLYRHGEWAVTHPLGYFETYVQGSMATNGMVLGGLGSAREARGPIAMETDPQGTYSYLVGATGGQYATPGYWTPPPTYLHEWTRTLLYLPSSDKASDTIVVYDRTSVDNPLKLPGGVSRYAAAEQQQMTSAPALKQWVIHAPVQPAVTASTISWSTAGGQHVQVSMLLPQARTTQTYDEMKITFPDYILDMERHWQVRVMPSVTQQWDTFLNVVQAYDTGAQLKNTLVKSTAGEAAEGALISRGNHNDVLALFSARNTGVVPSTPPNGASQAVYNPNMQSLLAAASALQVGYTVSWTSTTAQTDLYLANLDPTRNWIVSVDGKASAPLMVSNQGLGRMQINGAGVHSLNLGTTFVAAPTYTIQGQATSNGAGLPMVTISAGSQSVLTAPDGSYTLSSLPAGTYNVTAARQGYNFNNAQSVTVGPNKSGVNFAGVQATYSISGKTIDGNGIALGNVNVTTGTISATSAADGSYSLSGLVAGTYTLTASLAGYNFNNQQTITVGPTQNGINFTGVAATYSISGKVVDSKGAGLGKANVSSGAASIQTAADGSYTLNGLRSGNYNVSANLAGFNFGAAQSITVGPSKNGVNFTAAAAAVTTYSISGKVTCNNIALANASVSAGSISTKTAADGSYTLNGLAAGTYNVSANLAGYAMSAAQSKTVGPNQSGVNFTAQKAAVVVPTLTSFTLAQSSYQGWQYGSVKATVTLSAATPGLAVTLSSSNSAICPVKSVWVSGSSVTFSIPVLKVTTSTQVTLKATLNGVTKSVVLTVTP